MRESWDNILTPRFDKKGPKVMTRLTPENDWPELDLMSGRKSPDKFQGFDEMIQTI